MQAEELFIQKVIEQQAKLNQIASRKEFEDNFISSTVEGIAKKLNASKKSLKTYYLRQYFIKKKLQEGNKQQINKEVNKKSNEKDLRDTKHLSFVLKECIGVKESESRLTFPKIDLLTSIRDNEDYIDLITYSVLPSYYNFFLSENDVTDFVIFLDQVYKSISDKFFFETFSSIIYHTPLFLNFCHEVIFKTIIIECLHDSQKIDQFTNKKTFYNTIIRAMKINHHLCPPLLKHFFEIFSAKEDFSLSDHIQKYFLTPLFECPLRFSVTREFDFLPDNFFDNIKKDDDTNNSDAIQHFGSNKSTDSVSSTIEEMIINDFDDSKMEEDNYIGRFINIIVKIPVNHKLLITEPLNELIRFFTSFDISILSNKPINEINFTDYKFLYIKSAKRRKNDQKNPIKMTFQINDHIAIFKELLKLADPLPTKIKAPKNIDDVFAIMEKYLVECGNYNTQVKRRVLFEHFKGSIKGSNDLSTIYLEKMNEPNFLVENEIIEKNKEKLLEVNENEKSIQSILPIFDLQIKHISTVCIFFNSPVYNDKSIISYDKSEIKYIVKNPQTIIDDYNEYLQKQNIKNLDQNDKLAYHYRKLSNLRFSDFLEAYQYILDEHDSLTGSYFKCNNEAMINQEVGENEKLRKILISNSFYMQIMISEYNRIFNTKGSPFEKVNDIINAFDRGGKIEYGPDYKIDLFIISVIKTHNNHLLSNFVYLENFYFKLFPEDDKNLRAGFCQILKKIFSMDKTSLCSSIIPFIAKTINGLYYINETKFKSKKQRFFYYSPITFKTYVLILNYSNSLSNLNSYDLVIVQGSKNQSILKKANCKIKIAVCNAGETSQNFKDKSIRVYESNYKCFDNLGDCIFKEYEMV